MTMACRALVASLASLLPLAGCGERPVGPDATPVDVTGENPPGLWLLPGVYELDGVVIHEDTCPRPLKSLRQLEWWPERYARVRLNEYSSSPLYPPETYGLEISAGDMRLPWAEFWGFEAKAWQPSNTWPVAFTGFNELKHRVSTTTSRQDGELFMHRHMTSTWTRVDTEPQAPPAQVYPASPLDPGLELGQSCTESHTMTYRLVEPCTWLANGTYDITKRTDDGRDWDVHNLKTVEGGTYCRGAEHRFPDWVDPESIPEGR